MLPALGWGLGLHAATCVHVAGVCVLHVSGRGLGGWRDALHFCDQRHTPQHAQMWPVPSGDAACLPLQVVDFKHGSVHRVAVVSYETLRKHAAELAGAVDLLICDEGHRCGGIRGLAGLPLLTAW